MAPAPTQRHYTSMDQRDLAVGIDQRHFEDYAPGTVVQYGPIVVTKSEVIEFGRRYDPQDFHVDPQRAASGPFGGLIASGWHTASMMMRVLVDRYLSRVASLGSPGIDELRWLAPVRPGDRLMVRITVIEAKPSQSKPDRGMVRSLIEVINQADVVVMTVKAMTLVRLRQPRPAGTASDPARGNS